MSATDTSVAVEKKVTVPRMWTAILHNDDYTPMDFVVLVLTDIFNKSEDEAEAIMLTVHHEGRAKVGTFTKEVAETKVKQVVEAAEAHGHPLLATAEPE